MQSEAIRWLWMDFNSSCAFKVKKLQHVLTFKEANGFKSKATRARRFGSFGDESNVQTWLFEFTCEPNSYKFYHTRAYFNK